MTTREYIVTLKVEVEGKYFDYESTESALQADDLGQIGSDLRVVGSHDRKYRILNIAAAD